MHGIYHIKTEKTMRRGSLMLVPSGGLANRMRAIASAYAMTQQIGSDLQILWFQDWALKAPFSAIFVKPAQLNLKEATFTHKLFFDRARRRNLWFPTLSQKLLFDRRLHEDCIWSLMVEKFDFAEWARYHRCYMSNYMDFYPYDSKLLHELFTPVHEITDAVDQNRELLGTNAIGIHIRRTDHIISTQKSPTSLFVEKIKNEIEQHADTKVYLATDSNDVKRELKEIFGQRILTPDTEARRDGIEGIRGGLVDMYTLAATSKIYGSSGSSFSKMASRIGNIELWFLEKELETLYNPTYQFWTP